MDESTTWKSYEEVARYLLDMVREELGLERVEGEQALQGKSGTTWKVEAKGVKADSGAIVVVECRRYTTSKLKQEAIGALAYRVSDVGGAGGIVVTPIGLQEGAQIIAKHERIEVIHLNEDATTTDYVLKFLERVFVGVSSPPMRATAEMLAPEVKVSQPGEPGEPTL